MRNWKILLVFYDVDLASAHFLNWGIKELKLKSESFKMIIDHRCVIDSLNAAVCQTLSILV